MEDYSTEEGAVGSAVTVWGTTRHLFNLYKTLRITLEDHYSSDQSDHFILWRDNQLKVIRLRKFYWRELNHDVTIALIWLVGVSVDHWKWSCCLL